nr:DedA family protein [Sphingomonas bacterium]
MNLHSLLLHYGLFALFLGAGFEGETAVVAGGLLAHEGLFSLPGAMAAAAAGSFVADQLFFAGGRYFRDRRWVRRQRERPAFARVLAMLERHPIAFIFAFRFIYGIRTISPIAIGTSRVREPVFLAVNVVAAIVWGVLFTAIGYAFGHGFERLLHRFEPSGTTIAVLAALAAAALIVLHLFRRRRSRATEPDEAPQQGA